jgi:ACR3 family arsenite efflux pump ArsB
MASKRLNFLDSYLTLWYFGNGYGCFHWLLYSIQQWFHQLFSSGTTNVPCNWLILMMYRLWLKLIFRKYL